LTAGLLVEYRKAAREPGAALWLSPSDRAADQVLRLLTATGKAILQPNVFSLASFAKALLPTNRDRGALRRLRIEEAAAELTKQGRFPYFRRVAETRGFLDAAVGFLEEVEASSVTADQLKSAAVGPRADKLAACAELYAAVAGTGWAKKAIAAAAGVIEGGLPPPFDRVRTVFMDGFASFTPVEWQLVETLARHVQLWIGLPADVGDRPEAFQGVHELRGRLAVTGDVPTAPAAGRPPGLAHLDRHLFGPAVPPATDGAGLHLIEAPGPLGEARLVARRIRSLLAASTRPEAIVVTARDLKYSSDLLGEVFSEYGLPVELDGDEPVLRNPAVGTLLRAIRLPDDGWPFAAVTALLRSTYFRPAWPEVEGDVASRAEGLLRLLGEPRGREAYLRAVRIWSEEPPDGLDDEQAEESRRVRKARLAGECRPFLERFFRAWDGLPGMTSPVEFATAVREFARDMGLEVAAAEDPSDGAALSALWAALAEWDGPPMAWSQFLRRLTTVAATVALPRSERSAGRIRVVPAEDARHLDCDNLFILGLGERSFPRLAPPPSLLDDADRQILRTAGLPFSDPVGRLGAEQLLFLQLVGRPRRELVLSYPAVDERGQPLLPGSYLRAVRECFADGVIPVERQRMLIEGYLKRGALSRAEARSQFAAAMSGPETVTRHPDLPAELCEHLSWARQVAAARFGSKDYNRFDGWVDSPVALAAVRDRFGAGHVFSPTALEAYVSCPFRFLLEYVVGLAELDEPGEEVEHTRRGAAYHRALARLHRRLGNNPELTRSVLPESIGSELLVEIDAAVQEYAERAPSPASRRLWELEGKRLHRSAGKYRGHWEEFLGPWRKAGAPLDPRLLEADFGLPAERVQSASGADEIAPLIISFDGVEVRIGGRIDRVDIAELEDGLGFWVIDYKTGRGANYTGAQLANFEKLQLPLYALAVERVFFPSRKARPLGLAYWLVTDRGPKTVMPGRQAVGWLSDPKQWATFRKQLEEWVAKLVGRVREGHFPLAPRSANCTETCPYGQVCRISQSRNVGKVWELVPPGGDEPAQE
jgi:ATP-dependent helicase/DNAse subunit B